MDQEIADELIVKLIENSLSEEESVALREWLQKEEHIDYFNKFIEINHLINSKNEFDYDASLLAVKESIEYEPTKPRYLLLKYAASVLILLVAGYFFLAKDKLTDNHPPIVENNIKTGTDKAVLTLEDGSEIILEKGQSYVAGNMDSNGEELIYKSASAQEKEISYNYLTIPRGGQFFVRLADSTKVWLNAESKLKYPIAFAEGQPREIELIYGEAYFEVSPSTNHLGSHFVVLSGLQKLDVLGTAFNLKAYNNEQEILTTLVEGRVAISINDKTANLTPNQQSKFNVASRQWSVDSVDVFDEVSWKNGLISFSEKPLDNIMEDLSRWYDFNYQYLTNQKKDIILTGVLEKTKSIEEILNIIEETSEGDVLFEINDKTITIK